VPPLATPADRIGELRAVQDPVFEQVADAAGAAGQQLPGVQLLDVLGQHEYRQARHLAACRQGGAQSLVGEGRRQPDVHDRYVRLVGGDGGEQVGAVVHRGDDLQAVRVQQPSQAVPQQEEVRAARQAAVTLNPGPGCTQVHPRHRGRRHSPAATGRMPR
jgi:hypothetical protein